MNEKRYPIDLSANHEYLHLEMPERGGHVGFISGKGITYNEKRTVEFFNAQAHRYS